MKRLCLQNLTVAQAPEARPGGGFFDEQPASSNLAGDFVSWGEEGRSRDPLGLGLVQQLLQLLFGEERLGNLDVHLSVLHLISRSNCMQKDRERSVGHHRGGYSAVETLLVSFHVIIQSE